MGRILIAPLLAGLTFSSMFTFYQPWALACGFEAGLHPVWRGAVCHALDDAAVKGRAAFGVIGADF